MTSDPRVASSHPRPFIYPGQRLSDHTNIDMDVVTVKAGGFGMVAIGRDHFNNGITHVLKTYHPERAQAAAHLRDLFIREALTWVRVFPHPNILRAVNLLLIDIPPTARNHPFLQLDYADGGDLRHRLMQSPPDLATALDWGQQLAAGLVALHTPDPELDREAIIHRDLSPGNILFHHGRLFITDLGLAKAFEQAGITATSAAATTAEGSHGAVTVAARSMLMGTPGYIAPERLRGEEATPAVDIYALGVLLEQFCARGDDLPPALTALFNACRAEMPVARPTAMEVLTALQAIAQGLGHASYQPKIPARSPLALAQIWSNWSMTAAIVGQMEQALAANDRALALNPQRAITWSNRAIMLWKFGRHDEALEASDHALALDSQQAGAWCKRGSMFAELGQREEALVAFDRALTLDSQSVKAWYGRGGMLGKLDRHEEALAAFDQVLALDAQHVQAWANRGLALKELGRYEEGIVAYDHALALDPENAAIWYNRGVALGKLDRYEEALITYDHALALDPQLASAWYNRGNALSRLGRYAEALTAYGCALALDPEHVSAWSDQGAALGNLGRWEEALTALEHALALDPDNRVAMSNKAVVLLHLGK